jgi:hypothetical protein
VPWPRSSCSPGECQRSGRGPGFGDVYIPSHISYHPYSNEKSNNESDEGQRRHSQSSCKNCWSLILIGIIRNGCGSHCDLNPLELQGVVGVVLGNDRTPSLWNLDKPEKWGQANSAQLVIVFFLTDE